MDLGCFTLGLLGGNWPNIASSSVSGKAPRHIAVAFFQNVSDLFMTGGPVAILNLKENISRYSSYWVSSLKR